MSVTRKDAALARVRRALDALQEAGLRTDNEAKRASIYREASRIIWSDLPYVPLYELRRINVYNTDLRHYSVNATSPPGWNAWQWDI